jgi:hypothetical protein
MAAPLIINPAYDEEEDAPRDLISPSPDVFSYFLLTTPRERKNHNRFTVDAFTSYLLVIFPCLLGQVTLGMIHKFYPRVEQMTDNMVYDT